MNNLLLNREPFIRFGFFFAILVLIAVWELLAPRRNLQTSKSMRWFSNLGIVSIDALALRLLLPLFAIDVAILDVFVIEFMLGRKISFGLVHVLILGKVPLISKLPLIFPLVFWKTL